MVALATAVTVVGSESVALPDRVVVPKIKTSIYVGSVTLTTTDFVRDGDVYSAKYDATVFPWFFWNEHGEIALTVPASDIQRLRNGDQIEFKGEATNHKGKPRPVSGRARPENAKEGSIKVRIDADGVELIFNGRYTFQQAAPASVAAAE